MEAIRERHGALLGWIATLVAAVATFTWLGRGALRAPSLTSPAAWVEWVALTPAHEATFALLRLLVLATAWYLLGVTTLAVVARGARSVRLLRVADALTVPTVRRVLQVSLGLGLATAAVASATAHVTRAPIGPAAGPGIVAAAATTAPAEQRQSPELELPAEPAPSGDPTADPLWHVEPAPRVAPPSDPPPPPAPPATEQDAGRVWEVRPGDHLWGIAEQVLAEHHGRTVSDAEVVPYWQQVIEANRDALVHRDDPDLILPGQRFTVPSPR